MYSCDFREPALAAPVGKVIPSPPAVAAASLPVPSSYSQLVQRALYMKTLSQLEKVEVIKGRKPPTDPSVPLLFTKVTDKWKESGTSK